MRKLRVWCKVFFKTISVDNRKNIKEKALFFGFMTPILLGYWLYKIFVGTNSIFLLFVLLFYFITALITNVYTFIGNIFVTKKFIIAVELPFKFVFVNASNVVSVEKGIVSNEDKQYNIKIFGFPNSKSFPINIYKSDGSICRIWCEKPDELFASLTKSCSEQE